MPSGNAFIFFFFNNKTLQIQAQVTLPKNFDYFVSRFIYIQLKQSKYSYE